MKVLHKKMPVYLNTGIHKLTNPNQNNKKPNLLHYKYTLTF